MDPHGEPAHEMGIISRALTAVEAGLARADAVFAARRLHQMAQRLDLAQKIMAVQARRIKDLEKRLELRLVPEPQSDVQPEEGRKPSKLRSRPKVGWATAGASLCLCVAAAAIAITALFGNSTNDMMLSQPDTSIDIITRPTWPPTVPPTSTQRRTRPPKTQAPTPPADRATHPEPDPTMSYTPTQRVNSPTAPPQDGGTTEPAPTANPGTTATHPPTLKADPPPPPIAPTATSAVARCAGIDLNLDPLARACLLG